MATYGFATSTGTRSSGHPSNARKPYIANTVIDFSTQVPAINDVFQAIVVPAKSLILEAGIDILTADTAGNLGTLALGDGTNTWVAAATCAAAGPMTIAAVESKTKNAVDTIDVTVGTGVVNAKIRVWAVLVDISDTETSQVVTYSTSTFI